ncbi:Crp/Fnr family transcriptional regulator [Chamaesiphon minutus]|uniref:cAMP-binding protein n=1 Tax=Chamaesiphon minutus (strain ATCC 27169 / PCC 6605) TaxID=1173020 RepID=K9UR90_CHAP6|nr:Crp/Fnr family transcriptional regulator [Chamaesiphon minutus]AFY96976.1 cAMP-binding protein [Chamaesiphon minutus PCC 6605]
MNFSQLNRLPSELRAFAYSVELTAGEILFTQAELAEAVFVVESGCILLFNYTDDEQRVNHYRAKTGELFAELMLFHEKYLCTAIADTRSRVVVFPKQPFLKVLKHSPELTEALMLQLAKRLHESKMLLELRSIRSAHKRVLHYLQLLTSFQSNTLILDRPLKDIALDVGLTPEALSRSLKYLQELGVISRNRREVKIHRNRL